MFIREDETITRRTPSPALETWTNEIHAIRRAFMCVRCVPAYRLYTDICLSRAHQFITYMHLSFSKEDQHDRIECGAHQIHRIWYSPTFLLIRYFFFCLSFQRVQPLNEIQILCTVVYHMCDAWREEGKEVRAREKERADKEIDMQTRISSKRRGRKKLKWHPNKPNWCARVYACMLSILKKCVRREKCILCTRTTNEMTLDPTKCAVKRTDKEGMSVRKFALFNIDTNNSEVNRIFKDSTLFGIRLDFWTERWMEIIVIIIEQIWHIRLKIEIIHAIGNARHGDRDENEDAN